MRNVLYALGVLCSLAAARVEAHALGVECKLVGGSVQLEAYYDDDTPGRDARVRVSDAAANLVAEGRTDAAGKWSFPRPAAGRYSVVVDAGDGHRAQVNVTVPTSTTAEKTPAAAISEGPDRGEFTRVPWLKLALGVGVLGLVAVAFLVGRARRSD